MEEMTPKQVVEALDRYIVGQAEAKRAVAVAIRNRWRRQQLPESMREEVGPKNIIMYGPTGIGKTEIARRLASLVNAPFIKVEATKYTEVGYHGRDVESIIRDLVDRAVHMVEAEQREVVRIEAERLTEEQLLDVLLPSTVPSPFSDPESPFEDPSSDQEVEDRAARRQKNREKLRRRLREGEFEESMVELNVERKATPVGMFASIGGGDPEMQNFLERLIPSRSEQRRLPLREARKIIFEQQCERLVDADKVTEMAIQRTENRGLVFLDELDKLCSGSNHGPEVSRQGVQRDLLPIVEGSTVATRYGPVRTDHILFIAAGAFHNCDPNDLMPELQGRFPIRVELLPLTREDFLRILTEPQNALISQQVALMGTEGVKLEFTEDAIAEMARLASELNEKASNIGARRLYTITEKLMETLSFDAPDLSGGQVEIDAAYVKEHLAEIVKNEEISRFGFRSLREEDSD